MTLRRILEAILFVSDEPIPSRLVRAKNWAQRTPPDLMENPERPECLWWEVQD